MSKTIPSSQSAAEQDSAITLASLDQVSNKELAQLSLLTLPEVEKLKEEVATILPAGNLPGLILMGLTSIKARKLTRKRVEDDLNTLFQGSTLLPESLFHVMISGPAVVLAAYQRLLQLAGKDVETAFPEGTWQFYLQ
ncbi:MAG: hypothetical protein ACFB51_16055, partial [Anaerolineae bacterium]